APRTALGCLLLLLLVSSTLPTADCSPRFPYTTLFRPLLRARRPLTPLEAQVGAARPREELGTRHEGRLPVEDDRAVAVADDDLRSEEHTSELQSRFDLVCRLLVDTTT